jgi:O-antigen/teichoic acid export membrane protein
MAVTVETAGPSAAESERGLGQRAASNTIHIFAGSVLSHLMGLVLVGYLARQFDVVGLGSYNLVVAYTGLFSLFADFGLIQYLTRELAARPHDREVLLRQAAAGSLAAGAIAFALCNGLARAVGYDAHLLRWILIASLPMFLGPAFISIAVLNAGLRGRRVAALAVTNQALGAVIVLLIVVSGSGIGTLIAAQAVQSFVYAMLIAWSSGMGRIYRDGFRRIQLAAGLRLVWAAVPLGAMAIIALVYYRLDTFLLSVIASEKAVGYYSGAWRLTEALHIVPAAVTATMLPLAARREGESMRRVADAIRLAFRFLTLIGVPILVGCMILAEPILKAVYGPALAPATTAFRILIVTEIIFFFGSVVGATLVGLRQVRKAFISQVISVPLNAAACAVVLPRYGYNGAAWISLATEALVVSYLVWTLRPLLDTKTSIVPLRPAVQAVIASAPMAVLIVLLQSARAPLILTIVAGAAVFGLVLVAARGVSREDLRLISALRGDR